MCGGGDEGGMTCPQVDVCVWWGDEGGMTCPQVDVCVWWGG